MECRQAAKERVRLAAPKPMATRPSERVPSKNSILPSGIAALSAEMLAVRVRLVDLGMKVVEEDRRMEELAGPARIWMADALEGRKSILPRYWAVMECGPGAKTALRVAWPLESCALLRK